MFFACKQVCGRYVHMFLIKYFDVQITVFVCYKIVHFEKTSKSKTYCFKMHCTACRWRECHLLKGF